MPAALRSASLIVVLLSGVPNPASGISSLRGSVGIRDQQEQARHPPPVLGENHVDEENNGVVRIYRRLDDYSELRMEESQKLYVACSDARAKYAVDGTDESLLAAQIACNTWFAWTDDK